MEHNELLDDLKYDLVINCPTCRGTGFAYNMVTNEYSLVRPETYYHSAIIDIQEWKYASNYNYETFSDEWRERNTTSTRIKCEHCKGNGYVYAYKDLSKVCSKCSGKGTEIIKIKGEIGLDDKIVKCSNCRGSKQERLIHIKTMGDFSGSSKISYCHKLYGGITHFTEFAIISTILDNDDKWEFYSKNKPRFQAGEKEREINRLNQILEENKRAEYKKQQELEINRKIKEEKAAKLREADLKKAQELKKIQDKKDKSAYIQVGILFILSILNAIRLESYSILILGIIFTLSWASFFALDYNNTRKIVSKIIIVAVFIFFSFPTDRVLKHGLIIVSTFAFLLICIGLVLFSFYDKRK